MVLDDYIRKFNDYYSLFDGSIVPIERKYSHTFRVMEYASMIADSLNLPLIDKNLAVACALFHDVARFSQWTKYETYVDSESFDHGDVGYEILKQLGIDDEIILMSTKYHNKYCVEDSLPDRVKMFCNITRDADKLDIMVEQAKEITDDKFYINDEVISSFKNHKQLRNDIMDENLSIFSMLRCLAFIFDMNFLESLKIVKEKNVINLKCDSILSKFDEICIHTIKKICNEYIDERIGILC